MLSAVALLFLVPSAVAGGGSVANSTTDQGFFDGKSDGWFWYKDPVEPVKEEPKPAQPATAAKPTTAKPQPPAGPTPFSAKWVRVNLPKYRDLAWSDPSPENLRVYLYLQQFAIDRSERFADVAQQVTFGDPYLDSVTRRPMASYASSRLDSIAGNKQDSVLKEITSRAGLFFFFDSQSVLSQLQASVVQMFVRVTGIAIVPISLDGHGFADGSFPNFKTDQGQAAKMGVVSVPALYLVTPDGQSTAIGQGALSLNEIKRRTVAVAYRQGIIDKKTFNSTTPAVNQDINTDALVQKVAGQARATGDTNPFNLSSNNDNFIPPDEIINMFSRSQQQ